VTAHDILVMRGAGPIGFPGAAEVVNMQPPGYLIRAGVHALPCIGDGRQSGIVPGVLSGEARDEEDRRPAN